MFNVTTSAYTIPSHSTHVGFFSETSHWFENKDAKVAEDEDAFDSSTSSSSDESNSGMYDDEVSPTSVAPSDAGPPKISEVPAPAPPKPSSAPSAPAQPAEPNVECAAGGKTGGGNVSGHQIWVWFQSCFTFSKWLCWSTFWFARNKVMLKLCKNEGKCWCRSWQSD